MYVLVIYAIIGSDNGLSPNWYQLIILTNAGLSLMGSPGTNFNEILIEIYTFSIKKIHLKMPSEKWRPFCVGLIVLKLRDWHFSFLICYEITANLSHLTCGGISKSTVITWWIVNIHICVFPCHMSRYLFNRYQSYGPLKHCLSKTALLYNISHIMCIRFCNVPFRWDYIFLLSSIRWMDTFTICLLGCFTTQKASYEQSVSMLLRHMVFQ